MIFKIPQSAPVQLKASVANSLTDMLKAAGWTELCGSVIMTGDLLNLSHWPVELEVLPPEQVKALLIIMMHGHEETMAKLKRVQAKLAEVEAKIPKPQTLEQHQKYSTRYDQAKHQEGDTCPRCCEGTYEVKRDPCYCAATSPPCGACTGATLQCNDCAYELWELTNEELFGC